MKIHLLTVRYYTTFTIMKAVPDRTAQSVVVDGNIVAKFIPPQSKREWTGIEDTIRIPLTLPNVHVVAANEFLASLLTPIAYHRTARILTTLLNAAPQTFEYCI